MATNKPFNHNGPFWLTAALTLGIACSLPGLTVGDLQQRLAAGEKLTVIDVRSPALFSNGHIPGAINIPASLCSQKQLPPLGKVVVCGEGLGRDATDAAAAALAAKPGITTEILEGGFAAWESAGSTTTKPRGMEAEKLTYITYDQLKAAKPNEVVLVDLRKSPPGKTKTMVAASADAGQDLTDLGREFPRFRQTHSPFASSQGPQTAAVRANAPLVVLIDNGDGSAESMARTLKANGARRVTILAGGEAILARHGQPGLQRLGSSSIVTSPKTATPGTSK